jgi:hypothetical protein
MSDFLTNLAARALNRAEAARPRLASRFEPSSLAGAFPSAFAHDAETTDTAAFIVAPSSQTTEASPSNFAPPHTDSLTKPPPIAHTEFREASDAKSARRQPNESTPQLDRPPLDDKLRLSPTASSSETTEHEPRQLKADAHPSRESRVEQGEERARMSEQTMAEGSRVSQGERFFDDAGLRRLEERVLRQEALQRERQQQAEAALIIPAAPQKFAEPRASVAPLAQPPPPALPAPGEITEPNATSINVTIGRIDVRAVMPQTPAPVRAAALPRPALSLEDYLKQREGGPR